MNGPSGVLNIEAYDKKIARDKFCFIFVDYELSFKFNKNFFI
jgi:hypothetical protein